MIDINRIIELNTFSKTEKLIIEVDYLAQQHFKMTIQVLSGDFSGRSEFYVSRKSIEELYFELYFINSVLSGTTRIEADNSDSYIEFELEKLGKLTVSGQIGDSNDDQYLHFMFSSDQTCLTNLIADFKKILNINDFN